MRKFLFIVIALAAVVACKSQQGPSVYVNPRFDEARADGRKTVEKIAVLDCTSSLAHADDPDNLAPQILSKFLDPELQKRTDYKFIAPATAQYAVDRVSSMDEYTKMLRAYAMSEKPDMEYLGRLASELQCDAFMIPVVDLWQKDEVDITENSTPATYVGATLTIISAVDGSVLCRSTEEDYIEGARSETGDRSLVTSSSGAVYADLGAKTHRAPPFEEVAAKVAVALAASLPPR